jgi:hypothetical protein
MTGALRIGARGGAGYRVRGVVGGAGYRGDYGGRGP